MFNNDNELENRTIKLKFKEELVDYEPDTEDDVNSIESYSEAVDYSIIEKETQKPIEELNNTSNLFAVPEADTEEDVDEEICEEVVEYETKITSIDNYEPIILNQELEDFEEISEVFEDSLDAKNNVNLPTSKTEDVEKVTPLNIPNEKKYVDANYHINCKNHCIERLDVGLDLYINRLSIGEKPCPMLKLQRRNCCERNPIKTEQKLPVYIGYKSEYGLSLEQLEKKERKKEMIKLREEKREQILKEYQRRKNQQNEEIFCQWLKNISRRKRENETKEKITKKCLTPTVFSFPNRIDDKIKERPKTAHFLQTRNVIKKPKRPNTTNSCVFIEVPQNLLRRGISLGDIFIRNKQIKPKKLHFLSMS